MTRIERLALVGFGEAARGFLADLGANRPAVVRAYDRKTAALETRAEMEAAYATHGVAGAPGLRTAVGDAQAILCLVTADQALDAARTAAPHIAPGTWWFDGNSCAPQTKARAAEVIGAQGGRYVDMAIMGPVIPKGVAVPVRIAGPDCDRAATVLRSLGFAPQVDGEQVGTASATKMIRSVMIKGIEALSAECFLAARRAGVEDAVLASLAASDPAFDWSARGAYNLERMVVHGARRAAEMREVVRTLQDLGLPAGMSAACTDWQETLAGLNLSADEADLRARADRVLTALDRRGGAGNAGSDPD